MRLQYKEITYQKMLKIPIEILMSIGGMFMFANLLCLYMFLLCAKIFIIDHDYLSEICWGLNVLHKLFKTNI